VFQSGYIWRLIGFAFSVLVFVYGVTAEIIAVTVLGLLGIILFGILLVRLALTAARTNKSANIESVEYLYELSKTLTSDTLATIDLGRRWPAVTLSHHLTSGRMVVVDVYNPQLMPAKSLLRSRQQHYPATPSDPRLTWYDSNLDLLPLPDSSVSGVFVYQVLSEISEKGDQVTLLKEIARILAPDGRLLIAEFSNTWTNRLRSILGIIHTNSHEYWRSLLEETGFEFQRAQTIQGIIICIRADKPSPYSGKQMSLDLDFKAY
jgi:ubiquinone/menaquinone biosynthesis C-methylase UbiE